MAADYSFVSRWWVAVPPDRVWHELARSLEPGGPRWWAGLSVLMAPRQLAQGERMVLAVRSALGYALRIRLEITGVDHGRSLAATSAGDLRGRGRVTVEADERDAGAAVITFHWDVQTTRAWMNASAWLLRPAFTAAHGIAMRRGERGLRRVLDAD